MLLDNFINNDTDIIYNHPIYKEIILFKLNNCIFDNTLVTHNNKLLVDIHWTINHCNVIDYNNFFIEKENIKNHLKNITTHKVWNSENIYKMLDMKLNDVKSFGYNNESYESMGGFNNKELKEINLNVYNPRFVRIMNYWHFCFQEIPKLYIYLEIKKNIPNLKLIFNIDKTTKWHKEILDILRIYKQDIIYVEDNIKLKNKGKTFTSIFPQRNILLDWVRKFYISNIKLPIYKELKNKNKICFLRKKQKIDFYQKNRRAITNYNDIYKIIKNYGFIDFDNLNMSIEDSINVFSNASDLIIDNGAGAFNLMWCNENTNVILINSPHASKYKKNSAGYYQAAKHIKNKWIINKKSNCHDNDWEFDNYMIIELKNILNKL